MSASHRIAIGGTGIDRSKPTSFTFDGKTYQGFEGDTLASALLANGVSLMGRSFKYHRPRGLLTMGSEEPNAIVEHRIGAKREPNTRATMIELYEGLEAQSQNRFPSLKFDIQAVNQLFGPFLSAGFYYKTFMWPKSFWEPVYEKIIRRAAGLGRAATKPDPDTYEHAHAHTDILIVGAGPSGLAAARVAAKSGQRVLLVEEKSHIGGLATSMAAGQNAQIDGIPAHEWCAQTRANLEALDHVTFMTRTCLFGCYDHNVFAALERVTDHLADADPALPRQRLWTIRAKQVIFACGSQERPLVFANNDRPGIMLASAVHTLIARYGVLAGQKFVLATNNDAIYATAQAILEAGGKIVAVVDARPKATAAAKALEDQGVQLFNGAMPLTALGKLHVTGMSIQALDGTYLEDIPCDCVGLSGGFSPDVHLISQMGARPEWNDDIQAFTPPESAISALSVGACNGAFALEDCLRDGHAAGLTAAKTLGWTAKKTDLIAPETDQAHSYHIVPLWECVAGDKTRRKNVGKAFVDVQNDVTAQDIHQAHQEGFISVEHTKRYTTLGMATDQGKTSNVNGLAILADARGQTIPEVGTTRFRPPYSPVAIGAFAGHARGKDFQPTRRTAMHECGVRHGAVFIEAGQWLRPQYYPLPGEDIMQSIYREAKQVRQTAGICDVSSLGKIEIFGDDAGEFLNRLYINGWKMLAPGKARYGVMLREDGMVMDDGTTSRFADDHYFMTTTTANAAGVLAHMEHASQVLWPDLDVHFCSVTEQWCGVAVAGPNARKILSAAFGDALDMSADALPFMGVREFDWPLIDGAPVKARIFRISFSGELAFEVNVPWQAGEAMWGKIWQAGEAHGLIPYGSEALAVLRIEKGHVSGAELDGRATAADMGLGKMMSSKKPFIGQVMAARAGLVEPDRPSLVGLKLRDSGRLRGGAHLFAQKSFVNSDNDLGWVTSVCDSPAMGGWIGLAYLKGGLRAYEGKVLYAVNPLYDEAPEVEVCSPHFFDPEGARLHG